MIQAAIPDSLCYRYTPRNRKMQALYLLRFVLKGLVSIAMNYRRKSTVDDNPPATLA